MFIRIVFPLYVLACAVSLDCQAAVFLPDILGDNMVLQRSRPITIWGTADPGEAVHVAFLGQETSTAADEHGRWKAVLGPFEAHAQPASMAITGTNRIVLNNILVGEVWLCSGQSNMQWTLEQSDGGEAAIQSADHPQIRLFNVSRDVAFKRKAGKLASWEACTPATARDFSGVGYFFGLELYQELGIPVGLVNSSYGGSQAEAWTPVAYLAASEALRPCIEREKIWEAERPRVQASFDKAKEEWKVASAQAEAEGKPIPREPRVPDALRDYRIAASIYDNMIAPLLPFAIRGALWYQGESNEERAEQYELLLPTMIRSWRERWGQGDFPFAIVQLPNFRKAAPEPADEAWSHIRDAQRKTFLQVPKTGLIVTIDIGEADDIHPTNKLDVGHRLCLWALSEVYGRSATWTGPVFRKARFTGNKAILTFDEVGAGLRSGDGAPLRTFATAGADEQWHWARATIKGKRKVIVWGDGVVAVRYAFNNNPDRPNLSNDTGLPVSPFRTDNWPGPTAGKR